jgi:hypothetical protein
LPCSLTLRALQLGGGKVTDPKDIDKLRASLERLASSSARSLARVSSGKRPVVGDGVAESAPHNRTLLYNLMGACHTPTVDVLLELQRNCMGLQGLRASDRVNCVADTYIKNDVLSIEESIVNHVEYTLARSRYNFDNQEAYQATALSLRDRLIESWNDTQQYFK